MPSYPAFIVDAFAEKPFKGNIAAVCLIDKKLSDGEYLQLAKEFNFSETCYPLPLDGKDFKTASRFSLRWFTVSFEINLCGHGTLASSHVLFNEIANIHDTLHFETLSGELVVHKSTDGKISMEFPQYTETYEVDLPDGDNLKGKEFFKEDPKVWIELSNTVGPYEKLVYSPALQELLVILDSKMTKSDFENIKIPIDKMLKIRPPNAERAAIVLTFAPTNPIKQGFVDSHGRTFDYTSRYFDPWSGGLGEDAATGSSQCTIAPFWAKELNKTGVLRAYQAFPSRGAEFELELLPNNRLLMSGKSFTFVRGTMEF